jgi:hypothetical protein
MGIQVGIVTGYDSQVPTYERKCQGQFSPSQGRGEFFGPKTFSHVRYLEPRKSCTYDELSRAANIIPSRTAQEVAEILDLTENLKHVEFCVDYSPI